MAISQDLNTLLPQYSCSYCHNAVSVIETSSTAKIREVRWTNSCFHTIDCKIIKNLKSFFGSSPEILHYDCDGIITFEEDGKKYMFLSELKSTFDTSDIYKAYKQIISSYIKVNVILNMSRCYNKEEYVVKGFIFSKPADKDYLMDLSKMQQFNPRHRHRTEAELCNDVCCSRERKTKIHTNECNELKGLPLSERVLFDEMEIHFVEVSSDSIELDVHSYI